MPHKNAHNDPVKGIQYPDRDDKHRRRGGGGGWSGRHAGKLSVKLSFPATGEHFLRLHAIPLCIKFIVCHVVLLGLITATQLPLPPPFPHHKHTSPIFSINLSLNKQNDKETNNTSWKHIYDRPSNFTQTWIIKQQQQGQQQQVQAKLPSG